LPSAKGLPGGLASSGCERAIDRCHADAEFLGDALARRALVGEPDDVVRLGPSGRRPAPVLAFALGLGNALALALQHHLALELRDAADHVQHQPATAQPTALLDLALDRHS